MLGVTKKSAAAGDVDLFAWPEPKVSSGHVIFEVLGAGVCGTDLHIFRNEYKSAPPVILGHEVCGRVVAVGDGVSANLVGNRFVAETFFHVCGECRYCRLGRPNLCKARKSIGSHVNGAMAPLVEIPAHNLHSVPDGLSDAAASLAEPVACVTNSLFGASSHAEPGQKALVIGPGAIGLVAAQVARAQGAEVTVRGTERDVTRLGLAKRLGYEISEVGDNLPEESFDVVVECSGNAFGYADALKFAARGSHVSQMGLSGTTSNLPTDLICYKELTITSGFASTPRSWERAMRLIRSGKLNLEALITEVVPLKNWKSAFDRSFAAEGVKFVLAPNL